MIRVLDLFSGIGGISLGLESNRDAFYRPEFQTVAFCEINPFCREVLKKHWPGAPVFEDVTKLTAADVGSVDMITGGFPCQDISCAGKGAGLGTDDSPSGRSGLWFEMLRLVRECRPAWVLAENVPALYSRGYDVVAAGLEAAGYSVRPVVVGAWAVGAPHKRDRVWIVAHDDRQRGGASGAGDGQRPAEAAGGRGQEELAHLSGVGCGTRWAESAGLIGCPGTTVGGELDHADPRGLPGESGDSAPIEDRHRQENGLPVAAGPVADPALGQGDGRDGRGVDGSAGSRGSIHPAADAGGQDELGHPEVGHQRAGRPGNAGGEGLADTSEPGCEGLLCDAGAQGREDAGRLAAGCRSPRWPSRPGEPQHYWEPPRTVESRLGGDVDGLPARLVSFARRNALKAYGNSVVPQVVAAIGKAILEVSE